MAAPALPMLEAEPAALVAPARKMPTLAVMAALTQRADPAPADSVDAPDIASERAAEEFAALAAPAAQDTWPADDDLSTASITALADAPASATPQTPPDEAAPDEEQPRAATSSHGMWWPQAARRRAAPETRPIAVAPRPSDEDLEATAPRPALRRPLSAADSARPQAAPSGGALEADALFSRRTRASGMRLRAEATRSPRVVVLSWAAGGHAAVASVAALLAVIAALRGSAGPAALTVFGWALALALIAGLGAALGYLCAQMGRPQVATLALLLSQTGALAWALGLLGPRAALLALAPASAALALRGAGRLSAVVAALAWMALFIVAEALTLTGALTPSLPLDGVASALVDVALPLVGLWLAVSILISLYSSRLNVVARGRAVEHAALLTEERLDRLRTQTEDDADALRRALSEALRGEEPERVYAHGALSVVADEVNAVADRLVDLRHDRVERKRLESAARRLTRVIERAWLGLSWSWPDATGTMLDDLLALLRTPPPPDTPDLLDDTAPTGQVVAPHLFRGWRPTASDRAAQQSQPGLPSAPSAPSQPSLPSLWPSDPGAGLTDPLELPPSPRWRSPDARRDASDRPGAPQQ
jgi:hypothetical protein